MRVLYGFTTIDGEWFVSNKPYSITRFALDLYGSMNIPGKGGANHLFVRALPGSVVHFNTSDGKNPVDYIVPESGWVNHPLTHDSSFVPSRGELGPWVISVNGVEVMRGAGLPDGMHVSTFYDTVEDASGSGPVEPPPQGMTREQHILAALHHQEKANEHLELVAFHLNALEDLA